MKKLTLAALVLCLTSFSVYAHPGRTASDGCHYCRTNCDKWGEQYGARHCHGRLKVEPSIETIESAAVQISLPHKNGNMSHSHGSNSYHPIDQSQEEYN